MSLLDKRTDKKLVGDNIEDKAVAYLSSIGLKIVAQNYLCKMGEIDIIAREKDTLVFIEVRYRKNNHFGGSAFSVNQSKQKRVVKAAAHYLQSHRLTNKISCRFDVMAIEGKIMFEQALASSQFNWIKGAFNAIP